MADKNLSNYDNQVLNRIFNPECISASLTEKIGETEVPTSDEMKKARQLEVEAIQLAEQKKHEEALAKFNEAIEACQEWASSYNNRAQLYQLMGKTDEALEDLNKAIELTKGEGHVASLAYCQRAIIERLKGDECKAEQDFQLAAKLGNPFAKHELVKMNPYAALCGQMLHDMFKKVREGDANFS